MQGQTRSKIATLLRIPEVQFFLIFSIPFTAFFLVNYNMLPQTYKLAAVVVCAAAVVVVLMQTVYSVYAHRQQKKQENAFLSMTAHQMRTPVTAIQWALQELTKKDIRDADRAELIRAAGVAGEKLVNIIDAFGEAARIGDHQGGSHVGAIDLVEFLERIVAEAEPVSKQYGVAVYFEKPQQGIEAEVDAAKLEVALANLVSNGIKYNHYGGMVTLHIRPLADEQQVEIIIEDSGMGMTPAEQAKIFTKYFRTEGAQKANVPGSGLGLYLTKTIVEQHHGRIFVESVQGKGSTFRVILPLKQ